MDYEPLPSISASGKRGKSGGVIYTAAGLLILIIGLVQFSSPGEMWPTYLASFAFASWGVLRSQCGFKRSVAIAIALAAGFLGVRDLLHFL